MESEVFTVPVWLTGDIPQSLLRRPLAPFSPAWSMSVFYARIVPDWGMGEPTVPTRGRPQFQVHGGDDGWGYPHQVLQKIITTFSCFTCFDCSFSFLMSVLFVHFYTHVGCLFVQFRS